MTPIRLSFPITQSATVTNGADRRFGVENSIVFFVKLAERLEGIIQHVAQKSSSIFSVKSGAPLIETTFGAGGRRVGVDGRSRSSLQGTISRTVAEVSL
jgi:hypothetical protein